MGVSLKRNWMKAIASKKIPQLMNSKGAKRVFQYGVGQLKHPAVAQFAKDAVGIGIASGGNPEVAAPMLAARTAQEGMNIAGRTMNHFMR
jgi:hypothetical protein